MEYALPAPDNDGKDLQPVTSEVCGGVSRPEEEVEERSVLLYDKVVDVCESAISGQKS